jgi:hypothetical protein
MTLKNTAVVEEFANYGTDESISSKHLYFIKDVLFSYGSHFPLCLRLKDSWIINADGYSMSTSTHRGHLIREITGEYSFNLDKLKKAVNNGEITNIKFMTTQEMNDIINEFSDNLRFLTKEDILRLKVIKDLK